MRPIRFATASCFALSLAACSFALATPGCSSGERGADAPPPPPPGSETKEAPKEDDDPIVVATRLHQAQDLEGALRVLREALRKDPSSGRARYLYATLLLEKGELRGAGRELELTLVHEPDDVPLALAWTRLGEIRERLGEHKPALDAYNKAIGAEATAALRKKPDPSKSSWKATGAGVQSPEASVLPQGSPDLHRAVARVSLFLGNVEDAQRAIEEALRRGPRDPQTLSLAVHVYKRSGDEERAVLAARSFLDVAGDDPIYTDRARELRELVKTKAPTLTLAEKTALVDYVRTAIRPHLPGETPEEGFFSTAAHERLLARDDRSVFVTLLAPEPGTPRLRFRGKGRSLAAGLAGAVQQIKDSTKFEPTLFRRCAVRIDLEKGKLEPIVLSPEEYAPLDEPVVLSLVARPAVEPGIHGVALRVDDREIYCLPGDAVTEDLPDVKAMLEFAARQAGLSERVWESAAGRVFRFQTDAFVSVAAGTAPADLVRGEPAPFPEANPELCADAATLGALWLAQDLVLEEKPAARPIQERLPNGEVALVQTLTLARFHYEYAARADRYLDQGYNDVRHAGAALALATAAARTGRPELRDAAILASRWLEDRSREVDGRVLIVAEDGKARLGTQAIALLLEDELVQGLPAGVADDRRAYREGLARTLVAAMREDGTLPELLATQAGGTNQGESQFFPGEAVLALVRHFKATGEKRWLEAAQKTCDARIREWRQKAQDGVPPLDAWLARAICEMDALPEIAADSTEQAARRSFALQFAAAAVAHQRGPETGDAFGGLAPPSEPFPRGMPTASLGEGLAAVANLARLRGLPEAPKLRDAARAAASFALRHQFTARNSFYLAGPERARGAFRSVLTSSRVRIDGVQHNVEFLLEVERLLRS